MNLREAFEAWANHADGANPYTPGAFDAFQAGAAFAARECFAACHEIAISHVAQEGVIQRDVYVYEQGIGAEKCEVAIRATFPEAFK